VIAPLDPSQSTYGYRPAALGKDPAVSVITPYYNTGPLFLETVQSLLRQSLQQWEWIIVNDGSTDEAALRTLLPLRAADERIRVLDQPNRGLPGARNAGVKASRAPLLFFLDSDDLLAPTALEKLAWTLYSRPGSAFATSWTVVFGHEHAAWRNGFDTRHAFLAQCMASAATMVRRSAFDAAGGFDEARTGGLEDYEFWLRCAANGYWGHDLHEFLIWIRRKAPQAYADYQWTTRDRPRAYQAFRQEMRARYPRLFRDGLPHPARDGGTLLDPHALVSEELPFDNRLAPVPGQRRVLMLVPWVQVGGSDRFTVDMVAGLVARDCRVSVCTLRPSPNAMLDELRAVTPDVFDLPRFLEAGDYPRFLHYLVRSRAIDQVLISNDMLAYQLVPYLRAHCPDLPLLDYIHMEERPHHGGYARAALEFDDALDLHVVTSEHLRRWLLARGADPERVAVCTINIDTRAWAPDPVLRARVRGELGLDAGTPLIVFVGRLVPQKRPRLAAAILRELRDAGVPFVCLVAGDGQDMGWMRSFVRRHRLTGQVRLLGMQPHARVRELLAAGDILLLPSENEAISLVATEAMAMGVVPVAAAVGGLPELVTPECGVLVPPGEGELAAYVAALRHLIEQPAERQRLAEAGRARVVQHFDSKQMVDRMLILLDDASERAQRAPRPPVSPGFGTSSAAVALEMFQLKEGMRRLPPVRVLLALRWSSAWPALRRLGALRSRLEAFDRQIYVARRQIMWRAKKLLGRPYTPL
jgi:glycosyltransferase involved in cell wall biosynthesis